MTITEIIRQETFASSDALSNLEEELHRAVSERDAADERVKRSGTEITSQRTIENETKRELENIGARVGAAQSALDKIEEQRQAALEDLLHLQEEHDAANKALRAAHNSVSAAEADFTKEQRIRKNAERRAAELETERCERAVGVRQDILRSLDRHLKLQTDRLYATFDAHERRMDAVHAFEEFKKARGTDLAIGLLCEQRDELLKLLDTAIVPAVRDLLQESLKRIEDQLRLRSPGAVITEPRRTEEPIEELLFYRGERGKAVFLLPIALNEWHNAESDSPSPNASKAMCFIWNFLRELKVRTQDGEFITTCGRPAFRSQFDLDDTKVLEGFSIKCHESILMRFVLSAAPCDLQEALSHESEDV